jgi:uncharacterized membrane protein
MMTLRLRFAAIGLLLAGTAPVLAQTPPPPTDASGVAARHGKYGDRMRDRMRDRMAGGMFAGISDAGQATMREAMKAGGDPRTDHDAVKAARDRMLGVLDADTLDTPALKRAMDDERKASQASHERRQAAMLAGFTKLSVADRKAFVANARSMKARMEARLGEMRGRGGRAGPRGDAPPPPLPMM